MRVSLCIFLCRVQFSWLLTSFLPPFSPTPSNFTFLLLCVWLVFEIAGSLFWNTGFCRSLAMRSVKLRLPKSPHATTNSSHPCLSFSYISLPSNRPDRLIIFLLLPKFRRTPSPNRLHLLIPSCLLLSRI